MTDPKPPAASRSRYCNLADELVDLVEVRRAQGNVLAARQAIEVALRAAAKEAQLRVLTEVEETSTFETWSRVVKRLRDRISKEGPL